MRIEYEATFPNINKDEIRARLKKVSARLIKPEYLQKRYVFDFPTGHQIKGGWARVRDDDGKFTMSLKIVDGDKITDQKEICLVVDDFDQANEFLLTLGCRKKGYQESKRELWQFKKVEITIDEWPYLEPYVEIEGQSEEEEVKEVSELLDFDYSQAIFGSVDTLYNKKYNVSKEIINYKIDKITFNGQNPFLSIIN